ncbi:NAD(+) synthase [Nitrosomonas sp.]|uniref:NAD(+) synthase n=1 Tax=Nitrosomonas sp. TaxID=42353 RepID=UPI00272F0BDA|nr:NAD(+) synthase [Nitrosomonas sp.]MDP2225208.1 NAD(+) synthase [Nitrosomonas sp.]
MKNFHSIYSHNFIRVSACIPSLKVADPVFNVEQTLELARRASEAKASIALFPELGISSYTADDLFHQQALLDAVINGVEHIVEASRELTPVLLIGAPLRFEGKLFNCAVVIYRGSILGIVPKTYLPNYREFYEKRQFTSARTAIAQEVRFLGQIVPFGNDLIFNAINVDNFSLHAEICEDLWTPIPPSTYAAMAGATILANLSASNITIGKADYRRNLCALQSSKCIAAYLYTAAGPGESTTDLAWDGHAMIYENNQRLAESKRFSDEAQIITTDIDLERLAQDRMRMTSFNDSVQAHLDQVRTIRPIEFEFTIPDENTPLLRSVERFPYVPSDSTQRDDHCYEAYHIQVHGLMKRLSFTKTQRIVIGVSGGLDSAHALIVAAHTMDRLNLPRANILAYTMPGFATSDATKSNAMKLMGALGVSSQEIDIRPSCLQMLKDIAHPFSDGKPVYDVTFENVQAGERTSHLFRLANLHNAIVLGTGDLSELALGWCTYGVGDHMSHYSVNASVPKTLIQHLIRWTIHTQQFSDATSEALSSILNTEISPELIPSQSPDDPLQSTQKIIGPYELQDFNLYYTSRFGFRPAKIAFLALHAWSNRSLGHWPDGIHEQLQNEYDLATIKHWLSVFLFRFFQTSQFKRSCIPNAPKVGSGGSLSPRGDWRAPSDAEARIWLDELKRIP